MNGKGIQTCEMIKESGREGCEIVSIHAERWMIRKVLGKRKGTEIERYSREERPVNKSE